MKSLHFAVICLTLAWFASPRRASAQTSAAFPTEPAATPPTAPSAPPAPPAPTAAPAAAAPTTEAAPAPAPQQPAAPQLAADPAWKLAYAEAREELMKGNFEKAARMFRTLAAQPAPPQDRALAFELAQLAANWDARRMTLVAREDLSDSVVGARARNERTTDEISILYVNSVAYGLGTGAWLAVLTEPDSIAGVVLPSLALAGAAAGGVALADNSQRFRYGVPASIVSGMYIGLEEGLVWTLWNQARSAYYDEWDEKTVATIIWGSASAGALAGGIIGSVSGTTPGRASYVGSTALWGGLLSGFLTAAFVSDERDQRDDAALLVGALGLNAGAVIGAVTAGVVSPSIARVRFLDLGGVGGGLVAGGLFISAMGDDADDEDVDNFFGVTALGMAGGLGIAWTLTKDMTPDRGAPTASAPSVSVRPTLTPWKGGSLLGVAGTF